MPLAGLATDSSGDGNSRPRKVPAATVSPPITAPPMSILGALQRGRIASPHKRVHAMVIEKHAIRAPVASLRPRSCTPNSADQSSVAPSAIEAHGTHNAGHRRHDASAERVAQPAGENSCRNRRSLLPIAVRGATGRRWSTNSLLSRLGPSRQDLGWSGRRERPGTPPRHRSGRISRAPGLSVVRRPSGGCEPALPRSHSRANRPRTGGSCGGSPRRAGACDINGRTVTQAGPSCVRADNQGRHGARTCLVLLRCRSQALASTAITAAGVARKACTPW
ncbi:hypothetical protein QF034_000689 [Streptomyces africanus]|uniref:Uncharacterized protein n=1 Tax=Streptomyces africanus TaxID=231024 RepID=A0ABU0QGE5_9ACTN|nr:hypothetical protein [Streptomyces africanus]